MFERAFQHRSGRIIAFGRAVLALFFLAAIWLDRTQPSSAAAETYAILGLYVAASFVVLSLTWNDWWVETRLALPAHIVDLLAFLWLNYATEGYASPFFTFFVFLVFSATIRWGWRGTAATAAVIVVLYVAADFTAASWGMAAFEWRRFALRSSYLIVLTSMTMLWILSTRQLGESEREAPMPDGGARSRPDIEPLLARAAQRFGAVRALCVWSEDEEPWTWVSRLDAGRFDLRGIGSNRTLDPQANYRIAERGDAAQFRADALMGAGLADGRGNVVLGLGYSKRDPLLVTNRDIARFPISSTTGLFAGSQAAVPTFVTSPNNAQLGLPASAFGASSTRLPVWCVRLPRPIPTTPTSTPISSHRSSATASMGRLDTK